MVYALVTLVDLFTDNIGRASVYPSNRQVEASGKYDSNNALLYTGERALLLAHNKIYTFHYQTRDNLAFSKCFVRRGLLSRHPEPYRQRESMRPLSFDEIRGLFMAGAVNPQLKQSMKDVIAYGKANDWNFNDQPGEEFKGKPLYTLLLSPIRTFQEFKAYRARAKEIGLDNGGMRKAAQEFKYLNPLFFWTQPHSRMFYLMIAGESTSLWERSYFLMNTIVSAFKRDDGQNSSRIMSAFMHLALNKVEHKSLLVWVSKVIFHYSCRFHHGKNYLHNMVNGYFKAEDHPFKPMSYGMEVM